MIIQRFSLLTLTILVFAFACSKQGEGQHCVYATNGSNDCDEGLECKTPNSGLACETNPDSTTCLPDLCCPPRPAHSNVEACNQYESGVTVTATGGSSAGGGSGISEGETGGSSAGGGTGLSTGGNGAGGNDTGTGGSDTGGNSSAGTEPDAGA